jgi:hypothetical protein
LVVLVIVIGVLAFLPVALAFGDQQLRRWL